MENNSQVRVIVPGRQDKINTATLRPIVVDRLNQEGPLTLAHAAIMKAAKTYRGFHSVYSALYVMIAMPQAEPDPIFEAIWQLLTLPDSEKIILTVIATDGKGAQRSIKTENLPVGWRWEWMETGPGDDQEDEGNMLDVNPLGFDMGTPYNYTNHL